MSKKNRHIYFIARAFGQDKANAQIRRIKLISMWGIAISFTIMFLSVAIIYGFKGAISHKLQESVGDIQISSYDNSNYQYVDIALDDSALSRIVKAHNIKEIEPVLFRSALLKTENQMEGVLLKVLHKKYFEHFRKTSIREAIAKDNSNENRDIYLSETQLKKFKKQVGDSLLLLTMGKQLLPRKVRIAGVFDAGIGELNESYVYAQKSLLAGWSGTDVNANSIYTVRLKDVTKVKKTADELASSLDFKYKVDTTKSLFPYVFDWLQSLDTNMYIILILMLFVAVINMITTLIIMVLDKVKQIVVFKSLGLAEREIKKIFFVMGNRLVLRGLLVGNILAFAIYFVQEFTHIIHLDPRLYFVDYMPVEISFLQVLSLNVGSWLICVAMMILPTLLVHNISPARVLRN